MPRSLQVAPKYISKVRSALQDRGFSRQQDLADRLMLSRDTISKFLNGKTVDYVNFKEICRTLGLDWENISSDLDVSFLSYDPSYWVGREELVEELSKKIIESCRLLLILGVKGIGKTALAEKLVVELPNWSSGDLTDNLLRLNCDNKMESIDFTTVATKWLEEGGIPFDGSKPQLLLQRLVKYLQENQVLVLIDSLERLLKGNEKDGWNDFIDEWWEKFFLGILSVESCQSRLIVTSQYFPLNVQQHYRYQNFWHREFLNGLNKSEQYELFKKIGFDSPEDEKLLQIGKAWKGNPLALRLFTTGLIESFNGNVQAFWQRYGDDIKAIEQIEEALETIEDGQSTVNSHKNRISNFIFWEKWTPFFDKLLDKENFPENIMADPKLNSLYKEIFPENVMADPKLNSISNRVVFILIDNSYSMRKKDVAGSDRRRWDSLEELIGSDVNQIINEEKISDSISLCFFGRNHQFNNNEIYENIEDPDQIENIFYENKPDDRGTFIVPALKYCINEVWFKNISQAKTQGALFIIYTDGVFDDKRAFERLIKDTCENIDNQQIIKIIIIGVGSEIKSEENRNIFEELNINAKNNVDKNGNPCDIVGFALADEMKDIIQVLKDELKQNANTIKKN